MSEPFTHGAAATAGDGPVDIGPPSMRRRAWIAFYTVIHKEVVRFLRIWSQTLLPPAITMSLYFLIFGRFIGSRVGTMGGEDLPYIQFIMPGLIMMAVIQNSYANVVGSFFSSKFQHNIEEMLVSPMPHHAILAGYIGGGVLRGLLVGAVVAVVAFAFTHVPLAHPIITLAVVLLTAILFSLGGFINAVYARKFDDISIVPTFILTPLTYLGGVFYSIEALPQWAQTVSKLNPILYMVNAFRYGILGGERLHEPDVPVAMAFGVIVLFILLLYAFSMHLLRRGTGLRA